MTSIDTDLDSALVIDFESGEATLIVDIDVLDYTKKENAFALGPAVPAALTYEVRWRGPSGADQPVGIHSTSPSDTDCSRSSCLARACSPHQPESSGHSRAGESAYRS